MTETWRTAGATLITLGVSLVACASGVTGPEDQGLAASGQSSDSASSDGVDVSVILGAFVDQVELSVEGDEIIIRSDNVPDHPSPYFPTTDPRHEAYNGSNGSFRINPNQIQEQDITYRIPRYPHAGTEAQETPPGPIGVALNGVAFFNQYAGGQVVGAFQSNSFDQYNGHPQQTGVYHYHKEPLHLTDAHGSDALIGVLLDGFPVYGPVEDGARLSSDDLDAAHGHFGITPEFPQGIYHYHITDDDPWINGAGFHGVPGSVLG